MSSISTARRTSIAALTAVALTGTALSTAALAQDGGSARVTALDEIKVTARKREESLRDVPVAVTAFTGAALEQQGITDVTDMIGRVPGLFTTQNQTFGPMPNQTYMLIRGVGATAASDPAVGTFVDGIYQTSLGFDVGFLDVERVEILRGPQGALFGRNTQGGAINIVTRLPDEDFRASIKAEAAEFNTWKLGGDVSGALLEDKVYLGLSAVYGESDGYLDNITLGQDADTSEKASGRAVLRITPTDELEMILRLEGASNRYGYLGFGVPDDGSEAYTVLDDEAQTSKDDSYGASLTVNYDMGFATLTSITGANKVKTDYWYDLDASADVGNYQDQETDQRYISQEVRLASNGGDAFDWLVGFYYFDEVHDQARDFSQDECSVCVFPPVFDSQNIVLEQTRFDRDGWAFFGQATYRPVTDLDITVGARYSDESVTAAQSGIVYIPNIGSDDRFNSVDSASFDSFSPMGSVSYRWNEDVMTYVTVSRGYKAGGYDKYPGTAAAVGIPFDEETSTNYEVGAKMAFFDNRLQIDASAFIVRIKDMQLASTVISPISNLPVGVTTNVGNGKTKGFEFEASAIPVEGLVLRGNMSYVDATFTKLTNVVGVNAEGGRIPYVPKWTASASADYTHGLGTGGYDLKWSLSYRYVGSHFTGNGVAPFDLRWNIDNYDILDASVTLMADAWDVSLFVNNITDDFAVTRRFQPVFQPYNRVVTEAPRQFGVRLGYRW